MSEVKKVKKTYLEQLAEIEAMKKEAEATREAELEPVINDMKAKIAAYQITAEQLGFVLAPPPAPEPVKPSKGSKSKPAKPQKPKEKDQYGNTISYLADGTLKPYAFFNPANPNRKAFADGKRPDWLKDLQDKKVDPATYTIKN